MFFVQLINSCNFFAKTLKIKKKSAGAETSPLKILELSYVIKF